MQKVSYGVREVLLGEITKTSRAVAAMGSVGGGLGEVSLQRGRFCVEFDVEKS